MDVEPIFFLFECWGCKERVAVAYMAALREWQVRSVRDAGRVLARVACEKAGLLRRYADQVRPERNKRGR